MTRNAEDYCVLCGISILVFSGLTLVLWTTMLPHGLVLLGSAAVASSYWILRCYANERRARVLTRSISCVDCTEEAFKSLMRILNEAKISHAVRDHYTISLVSPFRGTIELRRLARDSYSNTHVDDLRTTAEFYFDLHETKYDVFRREKPAGTVIRARSRSREDSEGIGKIVSAVVESLNLKID